MAQLAFKWNNQQSYAAEDFIIAEANSAAIELVQSDFRIAIISGEESCGKTHLAHYFIENHAGVILDKSLLGINSSQEIWHSADIAVLEDIEEIKDETAFFHLLRYAETNNYQLLLTSKLPPAQLGFSLPDLTSRLKALPAAKLNSPDELLLRVFLIKCFADRQLKVSEEVINYISNRVTRSFNDISKLVEDLEQISSERKQEITIPLTKNFL